MRIPRKTLPDVFYFSLIGLAEILIFFSNPTHFFMGDTLLWMGRRYRSIGEFLGGFVSLDPSLWYRPLAQRTVESLLYPVAGLHPIPYRIVTFILFFACTIAVFLVTERLTESRRASWLATLFFAIHVTHAFSTYDAAFTPELLFTLFYVGSIFHYVGYLRTHNRMALIASAALFVGSLMSKETAVGLPFLLATIWLFLPMTKRARLRSLAPHFLILGIYLVFTIGYLHIRGIDVRQLIEKPGVAGHTGYQIVLGKNVIDTTRQAFSWAFNISSGYLGRWPMAAPWILVLKIIRVLICVIALLSLFTPRRNFLLIGIAWFLIAAAPTLPLLNHFLPYYLFAPLVGFSLAVGTALDWVNERCARFAPSLVFAAYVALFAILAAINANAAIHVAADPTLLGASAESALNGLMDLQALHPSIPADTTLVIFNEENPVASWDQANGMLFQMAYKDESIKTEYSSDGITISPNEVNGGKLLAFKLSEGRLVDVTPFVKQKPALLIPHAPNEKFHLEVSKAKAPSPPDTYVIGVPEAKSIALNVLWACNGVVEDPFPVQMDSHGETELSVGREKKSCSYDFVALQRTGEAGWVTVHGFISAR